METKSVYFKNLDAIRFIGAMFVFLQHAFIPFSYQFKVENPILSKFITFVTTGGIGVSLFFVLSGFLLTYLIITEVETTGKLNLKNFYIRRFLRIWPLYFAVVVLWFVIFNGVKSFFGFEFTNYSNIFMHLSFLSNFDLIKIYQSGQGIHGMFQNINWSVSIEEQFYLFWPLVFLLPKKFWLLLISGLLLFSIWFRVENANVPYLNYLHTFSVLVDLVMGGLFAYATIYSKKIRKAFENTNTLSHTMLFIFTFLVLLFCVNLIFGIDGNPFSRVVSSFLFASIIASQAFTKNKSILNLGNYRVPTYWGGLSYGIYLLHPVAIKILDLSCRKLNIDYRASFWSELIVACLVFILTLLLSKLSYKFLESKFLRHKKQFQSIKSH